MKKKTLWKSIMLKTVLASCVFCLCGCSGSYEGDEDSNRKSSTEWETDETTDHEGMNKDEDQSTNHDGNDDANEGNDLKPEAKDDADENSESAFAPGKSEERSDEKEDGEIFPIINDENQTRQKLYEAFINLEIPAKNQAKKNDYNNEVFDMPEYFELSDLISKSLIYCTDNGYDMRDRELISMRYNYIDLGNDGDIELSISMSFDDPYDTVDDRAYVFSVENGEVVFLNNIRAAYRSSFSIDKIGVVYEDTVYGPYPTTEESVYSIDAYGYTHPLYDVYCLDSLNVCALPACYLPGEVDSNYPFMYEYDLYEKGWSYGDKENFGLMIYHFPEENDPYFVFYSNDDMEAVPNNNFMEIYNSMGVNIVTEKEIEVKIDEQYKKIGLDVDVIKCKELTDEYIDLDVKKYTGNPGET